MHLGRNAAKSEESQTISILEWRFEAVWTVLQKLLAQIVDSGVYSSTSGRTELSAAAETWPNQPSGFSS